MQAFGRVTIDAEEEVSCEAGIASRNREAEEGRRTEITMPMTRHEGSEGSLGSPSTEAKGS